MRGEPRAAAEPLPGDGTGGPGLFRSAHCPSKKLCGPSHFLGPLSAAARILTSSIKGARRACMKPALLYLCTDGRPVESCTMPICSNQYLFIPPDSKTPVYTITCA